MLKLHPTWHDEGLECSAGWGCSFLPPQTSLIPAHHPQENSPYTDFQGLRPLLTSLNLELVHTWQVSSQALGGTQTLREKHLSQGLYPSLPFCLFYPWHPPPLASGSPHPKDEVHSTGSLSPLFCPGGPRLLGMGGKEGRGGERRISRELGGPVRSCDQPGLPVPPRWQCQRAGLKSLAGLRSKHPIQTGPSVSLNRLCQ